MAKAKKKSPSKGWSFFGRKFLISKLLRSNKLAFLPILLSIILLILICFAYQIFMADKYYPITLVGDTNISFLTRAQAIRSIDASFQKRSQQKLSFEWTQGSVIIDLATASASLDYSALNEGFKNSHSNTIVFFSNIKISPEVNFNLDKQLDNISAQVDKAPQNAKLTFNETPASESTSSASIQITDGINGFALDKSAIKQETVNYLLSGKYKPVISLKVILPKVTTAQVFRAKTILENLQKQPVKLAFENKNWLIDTKQLLALLDLETGENLLDKNRAAAYFQSLALEIDQPVQEGLFEFNQTTKKVAAFKQSQEGRKLNIDTAYQLLTDALASESKTITLPVEVIKPKIQTSDVNGLGIKELIGQGVSNFAGSIENRIYNITLTAAKINGVLVPPGQVFSFNQTIGDVSAATGYKQAYVIKSGRTVLDDGGGVCQDSTTLFRAVLNAGLPVIQRTAHAYRVGYYEQGPVPGGTGQGFPPGLDATVFSPSVDFQFKNDTSAHILIQAHTSGLTLYVDLYGTSDGRTVSLTKPVITNQTPPPAELRQDDPTLPKGTVKQVDWSAWGATVTFKRTVVRGTETLINETWKSVFKPWQAVYLVGTKE